MACIPVSADPQLLLEHPNTRPEKSLKTSETMNERPWFSTYSISFSPALEDFPIHSRQKDGFFQVMAKSKNHTGHNQIYKSGTKMELPLVRQLGLGTWENHHEALSIHPASRGVAAHTAGLFRSVRGAKGGVDFERCIIGVLCIFISNSFAAIRSPGRPGPRFPPPPWDPSNGCFFHFSPPWRLPRLGNFRFSPPWGLPKLGNFRFSPPWQLPKRGNFHFSPVAASQAKNFHFPPLWGLPKLGNFHGSPPWGLPKLGNFHFSPPWQLPKLWNFHFSLPWRLSKLRNFK